MQATRNAIRLLRSSSSSSPISAHGGGRGSLLYAAGSRAFAQPAAAASSALEKHEVSSAASFKTDLNLDVLDNVEVMAAVEEEFTVEIPNSEAEKFSTTAQLIDYIASHPQAR